MPAGTIESVATERILTGPRWETRSDGPVSVDLKNGVIDEVRSIDTGTLDPSRHGTLVMPALADAHDHGRGLRTLAYGANDRPLELWLPAMRSIPVVDPYSLAAASYARLVGSGVGYVMHSYTFSSGIPELEEAVAVCQAARDVGIRLAFGVPLTDRNRLFYGGDEVVLAGLPPATRQSVEQNWLSPVLPTNEALDLVDEIAEACEDDLVSVQYAPVGPQWCSDELLEALAKRSASTRRRIHMHFLETRFQREWADAEFRNGIVGHLDSIGLLTPKLTLAHCVWLRPGEASILADRGVTVVLNTSSNLRLRSGIAPVSALKAAGVRLGVGIDGLSLDDDDDAFREMRLAHLLHSGNALDAGLTAQDVLSATCSTGPSVVAGAADVFGVVEPERPADLVTLDYAKLVEDRVGREGVSDAELVLGRATREHVREVIVAGRLIYEDGHAKGVDEVALLRELHAQADGQPGSEGLNTVLGALITELVRLYREGRHKGSV